MIVNPGIRRFLGSAIQRLFNSASFYAPLTHTAVPQRAASGTTGTFTRATTATVKDHEGVLRTVPSGCARFEGARFVRNLLTYTEDLTNAAWIVDGGATKTNSTTVTFTAVADRDLQQIVTTDSTVIGRTFIFSVTLALQSGTPALATDLKLRAEGTSISGEQTQNIGLSISSTPTRFSFVITTTAAGTTVIVGVQSDIACALTFTEAQLEDVTAQTTQTAGEYVSVGALDYRSANNQLYLSLPGTAGHYASTPDSVANSITGDIDIRVKASGDWTPAALSTLVARYQGAGNRSYDFYLNTSGVLTLLTSADGTVIRAANSSAAVSANGFVDNVPAWLRVTRSASTGNVNFYTSKDGVTWTQLGTADVATTAEGLFDGTSILEIGSESTGNFRFTGKFYQVQIYNTIGGTTPVVDFNPHRDAVTPTGTITSSTTGEVWTINGASSVVRSDYYHGSFVDGVKCFPTDLSGNPLTTMERYKSELAATNLCLQSNAFTTTWTEIAGTLGLSQNAVGPDGATSAWTMTDSDAANTCGRVSGTLALTAAAYTFSIFVKKTIGAQSSYPAMWFLDAAITTAGLCTIDTTNGTATIWTAYTGLAIMSGGSARCTSYNNDYWRVELTGTGTAANWTVRFAPAATSNATQSSGTLNVAITGSAVFYGAQIELGSSASSYIATTTTAVTRNADRLTYSGGDIPNLKTLCATFRRESGVSILAGILSLSDGTANEYGQIILTSATGVQYQGGDGGVTQWNQAASNAYTPGTTSKVVFSMAANDIKMAKDGVAQTQDTSATIPTVTQINVGSSIGSFQLSGNVGGIYGWTRNLSQSEENSVTV